MNRVTLMIATAGLALSACQGSVAAAENIVRAPVAERTAKESSGLKTAIFTGGCFWGIEAVFSHVKGVKSAVSGYHGGSADTATYSKISSGNTGHAEAVRVRYDPKVIRYDQLLRILFSVGADPTLSNRQGPDVGSQYRAALVPLNSEQRAVASAYLAQMQKSGKWSRPIVTGVESYKKFYPAEASHQDFAAKNPRHGYIVQWDKPKVEALERLYPGVYSASFQRD